MNTPTLEVLRLQAEHIRQQADMLRQHCETHFNECVNSESRMAAGHLDTAASCSESIAVLARHVHACLTCAIREMAPLPVCANDGKGGVSPPSVGQWFRMSLYNGTFTDAVVTSCVVKDDGAVDMELRSVSGERLAGIWSLSEQLSLHGIPTPSDTGRALVHANDGKGGAA